MQTGLKVFLAVAVGAFIGATVAFQMQPMFWWVGLLVGSLVGYFGYQPSEVLRAIPRAWEFALKRLRRESEEIFRVLKIVSVAMILIVAWGGFLWFLGASKIPFISFAAEATGLPAIVGLVLMVSGVMSMGLGISMALDREESTVKSLLLFNPISGTVLISAALIGGVGLALALLVTFVFLPVMKVLPNFLVRLFRLIHSDIRLLCGTDAAIGTAVGFFLGNALLGALVGGLIGVLNYELVSKRWLKLAPTKT